LITLAGEHLIGHVVRRFAPQVGELLISANRNSDIYKTYSPRVIADSIPEYPGPLAGILSLMISAKADYLAIVPCDSPFLPENLVHALAREREQANAEIAVASVNGKLQPVFALIDTTLTESLRQYLTAGDRKIDHWYFQHNALEVDFSAAADAFENINSPADLADAERRIG
ncbi:MAG: molybdenum cofactor guanylyltransferase MobA, partial [Pseudomonadota bacterium]